MATGYGGRPGPASSSSLLQTETANPALLPTSTLIHHNAPLLPTYASINLVAHTSRYLTFSHSNRRWQTRPTCTRNSRKIVRQQFQAEFHWFGNALSATISAQAGYPSTMSSGLELRRLAMADLNTKPVQELTVMSKRGLKLKGLLVESASNSKEVCVLCHGFRSSKQSGTLSSLSEALVEAGVSTFRFDFAGNGESEGEFAYGNYWDEVEDLRAVVEFLTSRGLRVVCVAGHSKGGNCVVLYASRYHDVPCVINISGRFALEKGQSDGLPWQCAFMFRSSDCRTCSSVYCFCIGIRFLIESGETDRVSSNSSKGFI